MKRWTLALLVTSVCVAASIQAQQGEVPEIQPVTIRYVRTGAVAMEIRHRGTIEGLEAEISRFRQVSVPDGPGPRIPPFFVRIEVRKPKGTKTTISIDRMCRMASVEGGGLYYVHRDKSPLLSALVAALDTVCDLQPIIIREYNSPSVALRIYERGAVQELEAEIAQFGQPVPDPHAPDPKTLPLFMSIDVHKGKGLKRTISIDRDCRMAYAEGEGLFNIRPDKAPLLRALLVVLEKGKQAAQEGPASAPSLGGHS